MAGKITVSTLNNDTGVLATQNGMNGIAKAWVNWNGSTNTINGSFNVASITKNGTGDFTVNFATAMPNANYSPSGSAYSPGSAVGFMFYPYISTANQTTSSLRVQTTSSTFPSTDMPVCNLAIFSS